MTLEDVDQPVAGPGEVMVRVLAAPANFPDVLLCQGKYQIKPPLPFTPGVELCGEVVAVGDGVSRAAVGERVVGTPV
ncbi:alcohol dehydrogenase catalytic domain-containing protein, partial [Mycobacterium tuberculosis]|nr:alcohol dehydrogenase catalytic domain-containing protein [Mycobacterium tuberculosis]